MLNDLLGMNDIDFMYNQSRAHSADMMFLRLKAWFYGISVSVATLLLGNIGGVFGINIMGWIIDKVFGIFSH